MPFLKIVRKFRGPFGFVLAVFGLWRLALASFEYIGVAALPFKSSFPYADTILVPSGLPQWVWQWGNFDGVHYLNIAAHSYQGFGQQVFFPGYPLVVRLLSAIVPNLVICGLIISNVSILLAAWLMYRLVAKRFDDKTARWATVFLFVFPSSFFFGSIYTESFFLLLVILAFSSNGALSGLVSFVSGLTRLAGVFLAPALFLMKPRNYWGMVSIIGLGCFMVFLYINFQSPLAFLSAQSAFGNSRATSFTELVTPFQVVYRYLNIFLSADSSRYDYWVAVLELGAFLFGTCALIALGLRRKMPRDWLVYSWLSLLLPTFSGTFASVPRYLLTIFPLYIFLAEIENTKAKSVIAAIFFALLGVLTMMFTRGYFVG